MDPGPGRLADGADGAEDLAVSGITLLVVPAVMWPTVTTAGSNTSTVRVTISCRAWTISQATGIGSTARCGSLAWPPLPVTVIVIVSAEAMIEPPRLLIQPDGSDDVMWMANAAGDRRRACRRRSGRDVEQALVEHEPGAVVALLAGLEHEQHPPGQLVAAVGEQPRRADEHGRVGVVAAGVHRAVDPRGEVEPGVLVHRQGVHVAAQEDRRSGLGAGEHGGDAAGRLVDGDVERQALDRLRARASRVTGSSLPTSGHSCNVRRSSTAALSRSFAASRSDVVSRRHRAMVGTPRGPGWRRARRHRRHRRPRRGHGHPPADAGRAAAPPRRVRRRGVDTAASCWCTAAARTRTCGPVAGTSPSAAWSEPGRPTTTPPGVSWPRRSASRRYPGPIGAAGTYEDDDVQLLGRCYRVVHDGPFRFADGEVVEARWVDAAELADMLESGAVRARQRRPAAARR